MLNARLLAVTVALVLACGVGSSASLPFDVQQITFPSPVHNANPPNPTVYVEYYRPLAPGRRPGVILVHHWGMVNPSAERELARYLASAGMAVAMQVMPYHLQRTPPGFKSGKAMVSEDVPRTVRAIQQAVCEVHAVADWLRERPEVDSERIGIIGISLGAIVAAIALGKQDDFDAAVLLLGGGDVADILLNSPSTNPIHRPLRAQGYDLTRLRAAFACIEPMKCLSPGSGEKVLMANGAYDFVIPRRDTMALWNCLGRPRMVWVESGHYIVGRARAEMYTLARDFLLYRFGERTTFSAPSAVRLHRVKVGLLVDHSPVIGVGGAVELVRFGRSPFAIDLNGTTGGLSAGGVVNVSHFLTVGVQRKLLSADHEFRPYVMLHVLM